MGVGFGVYTFFDDQSQDAVIVDVERLALDFVS